VVLCSRTGIWWLNLGARGQNLQHVVDTVLLSPVCLPCTNQGTRDVLCTEVDRMIGPQMIPG
jgi:hypothetical protein